MPTESIETGAQFQEILATLAAVDRQKSREELLAREANIVARKTDVAQRVREVYTKQGIQVSDRLIQESVDSYFAERLRFRTPTFGRGVMFARLWVSRRRILQTGAVIALSCIALGLVAEYGVILPYQRHAAEARRIAFVGWKEASSSFALAQGKLKLILTGANQECRAIGEDGPLKSAAILAGEQLRSISLKGDTAAQSVSTDLAPATLGPDAQNVLHDVSKREIHLAAATRELDRLAEDAHAVIDHLHRLHGASGRLEEAWKNFLTVNPPESIRARALGFYEHGVESVRAFGSSENVGEYATKILKTSETIRELSALPSELHAAAEAARKLSEDPRADSAISQWEQAGTVAIADSNLPSAHKAISELREIAETLQQSFVIRILNTPGEYTRIWYNNPSRTGKLYYIVVQAIGIDDQPIPLSIRSEQDGSVSTVKTWAERVDEATYEKVGADKKDDGVIHDNIFGRKERGHLDPKYLMGPKTAGGDLSQGRLNHWPHRR